MWGRVHEERSIYQGVGRLLGQVTWAGGAEQGRRGGDARTQGGEGGDGGGGGEEGAGVGGQEVVVWGDRRGGVGPVQQLWGEGGKVCGAGGAAGALEEGGEGVGGGGQEAGTWGRLYCTTLLALSCDKTRDDVIVSFK